MITTNRSGLAILMLTAGLALGACGGKQPSGNAEVEIRGTDPAAATSGTPTVAINEKGIATYEGYQAAVAREGDTVASIAARIGLSASELGAYNGLSASHPLQAGDELVLPPRPGGYGEAVAGAAPSGETYAANANGSTIEQSSISGSGAGPATAGATTAGSNGSWSPDIAAAAIERSTGIDEDGTLQAPPSSTEPVPDAPAPPEKLESPDLKQYQTPGGVTGTEAPTETETAIAVVGNPTTAEPPSAPAEKSTQPDTSSPNPLAGMTLALPVQGPIAIGFNKGAGPNRNDGVDFAVPPGTSVHAAEDGEVALVSQALGGLGTIILVRHPGDILTVYGRLGQVFVAKGDYVERGQQIGSVAKPEDGSEARMHFEVRRGAESVDPTQFF